MKSKKSSIAAFAAVALLSAGAAGAAMWWYGPSLAGAPAGGTPAVAEPVRKEPARYVTLDKVIVMLKRQAADSQAHYLSVDLVLSSTAESEKQTREHLPMLRSVAVRTLSHYGITQASTMTVEQYAAELDRAYAAAYAADGLDKPFSGVLIGKLIIE
jgi:flagellar FliL protein